MKNLVLVLIAAMMLFACNKTSNVRELPRDTSPKINMPSDPELFNPFMDSLARTMRKGGNGNNPHGGGDTTNPPTITKKICLLIDTNGEEVTNTVWTAGTISCASSGLNETQIANVVARVRSYWSQFDAEITTDESLFNTYPQNKRRRCVITTTNWYLQVYGINAGGVAYVNSLNWFDNTPCFVFTTSLGYNDKYISDATAHEFGHTAGCRHHKDIRYYANGTCYVYNEYLWSFHLMGASYYDANPIFTTGLMGCNMPTNDITNISNSINQ